MSPAAALLPALPFLAAGLLAGFGQLALLRGNVALLLHPGGVAAALLLRPLRLALPGLVLLLLARHGAAALLEGALGIAAARLLVLRRVAGRAP